MTDISTMPGQKRRIDWEAIERIYRTGTRSLKSIADEYGVSDAGIIKRIKRDGWTKDLSARIRQKADEKVSKLIVSEKVSAQTRISENEVVEANAALQANVRREQRGDIQRARRLSMDLLGELEFATGNLETMKQLGELMASPDDKGIDKLNEIYRKVTGMTGRVTNIKQLADTLKTLVALEREAFGIDTAQDNNQPGEISAMLVLLGQQRSTMPVVPSPLLLCAD